MAKTARDVLDIIDAALLELPADEAHALWSVLTALRGPDSCMAGLKEYTKAIRGKAFPRLAADAKPVSFMPDEVVTRQMAFITKDPDKPKTLRGHKEGHFCGHVGGAVNALWP